ncbi:YaiO family outer membrane beta-barrel protein [Phenylobacterium sp.]|uniref:YaiO family outer membrane beta-barrel protein n=1 Tax=Phenylobacterium sp. TaxID=1871053 RepID=UPI002F941866
MNVRALAACLVLVPAAAHAQPAEDPFARGVELRHAGRPAEALPLLEAASKLHGNDADVWLNLGLAYSATGQFGPARRALEESLRLAPGYRDAEVALARLAYFREDFRGAKRLLGPTLSRDPMDAVAKDLATQVAGAERAVAASWRLDVALTQGFLSDGLPSSSGQAVIVGRTFASGLNLVAGIDHQRQFGREDTYVEVRAAARWGYLGLGGTPEADFRPEWAVLGGLAGPSRPLDPDWTYQLGADAGWARYLVGDVRTLTPWLTVARDEGFDLTARWINVLDERDEHRMGYGIAAAWRPMARLALFAGWSDAPEATDGITTDVRAVSLGAAVDIGESTTLRLSSVREDRTTYQRNDLTLSLTRRF